MKVLLVGQLPVEIGGNYTTGIAKVVYALSEQNIVGLNYDVYATNAKEGKIICNQKKVHFYGYKYLVARMLLNIISHPISTYKQWIIYRKKAHANPIRYEFYKANFQKVLNIVKPDLIHMNGVGIEPLYFANKQRIPVVLTCHGVFNRFRNPESSARLYADYVTGLTGETWNEIINYLCVDEQKISIIPNGVDTSKFYFSEDERNKVRKEFNISETTKVFVTVASVQERKGQLRFTKLLKELPDKDWEYWIIGKGPDEHAIKEYCDTYGLSKKVRLLGYKSGDELYKYYSAADIYAHASTMEGQALCEIEAFSTGLKILVNDIIKGTIAKRELEDGDYVFVDFDAPCYPEILKWIGKRTKPRSSITTMDWHTVANQYFELYKKIANNK